MLARAPGLARRLQGLDGHPPLGDDDLAAAVAGLMVRLVGTRDWQIKTFHAPLPGISRTELCALVEQDILNNTGLGLPGCGYDSSAPPGGWPMGSPQAGGFDAQFSWSINRTQNERTDGQKAAHRMHARSVAGRKGRRDMATPVERTQASLAACEEQLAEARTRYNKLTADLARVSVRADQGDKHARIEQAPLNKAIAAEGRLVASLTRQAADRASGGTWPSLRPPMPHAWRLLRRMRTSLAKSSMRSARQTGACFGIGAIRPKRCAPIFCRATC